MPVAEQASSTPNDMRLVVRCPNCGLTQWARETCRRCRKSMLPPPEPELLPEPEPDAPRPYTFGSRFLALRRFRHLSQRQVAARLGVSRTYISKIEQEKIPNGPQLATLSRLARALQVPVFALLEPDELTAFASLTTRAQQAEIVVWLSMRTPEVPA